MPFYKVPCAIKIIIFSLVWGLGVKSLLSVNLMTKQEWVQNQSIPKSFVILQ